MAVTVDAPTAIRRETVSTFIRTLGLDPGEVVEMRFMIHSVEVTMSARDTHQRLFRRRKDELAQHVITIPMEG